MFEICSELPRDTRTTSNFIDRSAVSSVDFLVFLVFVVYIVDFPL